MSCFKTLENDRNGIANIRVCLPLRAGVLVQVGVIRQTLRSSETTSGKDSIIIKLTLQ